MQNVRIHGSAEVHPTAALGPGTVVWAWSHIRESAVIGPESSIGEGCYLGPGVLVGARCRIQNSALIYEPAVLGDGVFIGPGVVLTNDRFPRAVNTDGSPKTAVDWEPVGVTISEGAAIGARAVLIGPLNIGAWATVGAGAVVSRDVKSFSLVVGNPGRHIGWVGRAGFRLIEQGNSWVCPTSGDVYLEKEGELLPVDFGSVTGG